MYVSLSHFVVLFLFPQLLLQYLRQGFETFNTVPTCIEHVHKENGILCLSLLQNYVPFNNSHFGMYVTLCNTAIVSTTPPKVLDACNIAQTCIEHVH